MSELFEILRNSHKDEPQLDYVTKICYNKRKLTKVRKENE